MVKKQSTTNGFMVLGAAGIISKVLSIAYVPILTIILSNEGNGIYNAGYQVYAFTYVLFNQGAPVAISKCVSEQVALGRYADSKRTFDMSMLLMLIVGIVMSLSLLLFAAPASKFLEFNSAESIIIALSPTMLFTALASVYRGYFQGRTNMVPTGISQILEQVFNCVISILGAYLMRDYGAGVAAGMGLVGAEANSVILMYAAMGATFGTTIGALLSWCYLGAIFDRNKNEILLEAKDNGGEAVISSKQIMKKLLQFIIPISLGAALINTANLIDLANVKSRLLEAGFTDVRSTELYGILTTHWQKIVNIPLALVSAMAIAIIPQISGASATMDKRNLNRKIGYSYKMLWTITIPAAVGLGVLAEPILTALFPSSIEPISITMMQVGAISIILIGIVNMQTAILQAVGKVYIAPIIMFASLVVKIALNYFLVANKDINVMGAVIATIVCYILASAVNQIFVRKYAVKVRKIGAFFMRSILASAIMGVLAYAVYKLMTLIIGSSYICMIISLMAAVVVAAAAYFGALAVFNGKISIAKYEEEETEDITKIEMDNIYGNDIIIEPIDKDETENENNVIIEKTDKDESSEEDQ